MKHEESIEQMLIGFALNSESRTLPIDNIKLETAVDFCNKLTERHRKSIQKLMDIYIINIDSNGSPKSTFSEILEAIDEAVLLIKSK
jgi:hypothetical protein